MDSDLEKMKDEYARLQDTVWMWQNSQPSYYATPRCNHCGYPISGGNQQANSIQPYINPLLDKMKALARQISKIEGGWEEIEPVR